MTKTLTLLLSFIFGWFSLANASDLYSPEEAFTGKTLEFVKAIKSGDEVFIKKIQDSPEKIDINLAVNFPASFDFLRPLNLSAKDIARGNALTPAPYTGGYSGQSTTILNFFIINDDLAAVKRCLNLGANPTSAGNWYYDSFTFAAEFRKAQALDMILEVYPFSKMPAKEQFRVLQNLPKIDTIKHWFSSDEFQLDPRLLEVALKHHANFNLQVPEYNNETLLTQNMVLIGYETVLWLLEHTDADPTLMTRFKENVPSMLTKWLKGTKSNDKYRYKQLLRIKAALEKKNISL
jgi:hypothetical protein